jgi:hypothetical protein
MKKVLAVTAATAALLLSGSAYAQSSGAETKDIYVTRGASGDFMVNVAGMESPLLKGENGAAPANCPEGQYYSIQGSQGEEQIFACGNTDVSFGLFEPNEGEMMATGQPYPENAFLLLDKSKETGDHKQVDPQTGQ